MERITLNELKPMFSDDKFVYLGHGTGRTNNDYQLGTINSIFNSGLRTKDNSLYYTTVGLDVSDIKKLKTKLDNWSHLESENIILIRIPIEYINMIGDTADLNGERFGAFMREYDIDGEIKYYLDPKFIIGAYNVTNGDVIKNSNFEEILSEETLETLNRRYEATAEKTYDRLNRLDRMFKNETEANKSRKDTYNYYVEDTNNSALTWDDFDDEWVNEGNEIKK